MKTVKELLTTDNVQRMSFTLKSGVRITGPVSEYRVDHNTDTEGKYLYDIRHTDEDWCDPATVEDNVVVNWFGTIITFSPIDLGPDKYLEIKDYWYEDE